MAVNTPLTVTVREINDAIRKNGKPKITGDFFEYATNTTQIIGGCALGQAAYNLGVSAPSLDHYLLPLFESFKSIDSYPVTLNDETELSLPEIADRLDQLPKDLLDSEITFLAEDRRDYSYF